MRVLVVRESRHGGIDGIIPELFPDSHLGRLKEIFDSSNVKVLPRLSNVDCQIANFPGGNCSHTGSLDF